MDVLPADGRLDLGGIHHPPFVVADGTELNAAEARGAGDLVMQHVRLASHDGLVAATAPGQQRHQVRHGAAGHENSGFLARALGGHAFEPVDRGVLAEDVVADLGLGHGPAHLGRGERHGVAAQVDDALAHVRRSQSD